MIKLYFKQAWHLLRETPLLSAIAILGTALAICLVMILVLAHEVQHAPFAPEVNRDRTLYMRYSSIRLKEDSIGDRISNGFLSYNVLQQCVKPITSAEAVAIVKVDEPRSVSLPGKTPTASYDKALTDEGFWQIFDFEFVAGKPYTREDVASSARKIVITDRMAREVLGTIDCIGREVLVDFVPYTICGVVKEVSMLASYAYSQMWMPVTSEEIQDGWGGIMGDYNAYILAKSRSDFEDIRREVLDRVEAFNNAHPTHTLFLRGQPDTHTQTFIHQWANEDPDPATYWRKKLLPLLILLLVPAINLSGMMTSRMRRRQAELGVRRAFGAGRGHLMRQVLWESLLQTALGGVLGLGLSMASIYLVQDLVMEGSVQSFYHLFGHNSIALGELFSPRIFGLALLACLILNALSALWPAWVASRRDIVSSLSAR